MKSDADASAINKGNSSIHLISEVGAANFFAKILLYLPSQLLPAITAFITTPILTRLFLPAEYGNWAQAVNISTFLSTLAVSGFGSAVVRYYSIYKGKSTLNIFFATLFVFTGAIIIVVLGLCILSLLIFKKFMPTSIFQNMPLIILIFVGQSIFSVFIAVLRAQERSGLYTTFQLLLYYSGLGIGFILVIIYGLRIEGLLWGSFASLVLTLPFLILYAAKGVSIHPQNFHLKEALQMGDYAWPLTLGNVAMWGLRVSDLFLIGIFRPEREVGIYTVSYNISSKSIELLVSVFLLGVSPVLFRTWENVGQRATEKTLTMVTRVYLVLCLPAAVGLSVLAFPFVALLTVPDYYEGYKIIGMVVFSSFAWGLGFIASMGLTIKKQARQLGINQIIAAVTHISLQVILVQHFGYLGSAISTLIGYTLLLVLHTLTSKSHLIWRFPFTTLRNVTAASIVMGLVAWGIYKIPNTGSAVSIPFLLLSIIAAVPTYVLCLWWLGEIKDDEKQLILKLWGRVTSRKSS